MHREPCTADCCWRTEPASHEIRVNTYQPMMTGMLNFVLQEVNVADGAVVRVPCHKITQAGDFEGGSDKAS